MGWLSAFIRGLTFIRASLLLRRTPEYVTCGACHPRRAATQQKKKCLWNWNSGTLSLPQSPPSHQKNLSMLDLKSILQNDVEDEAVRVYIQQLLGDEDALDDLDTLVEILIGFCPEEDPEVIRKNIGKQREMPLSVGVSGTEPSCKLQLVTETIPESTQEESSEGEDSPTPSPNKNNEDRENRKEARKQKKQHRKLRKHKAKQIAQHDDNADLEDDTTAWRQCTDAGEIWGGRGKGGRGEYSGISNSTKGNIHLSNVTLTLPDGTLLLSGATIDLAKGRVYGLLGRNGVGKSTLMRRLEQKALPGLPRDMRIFHIQQHQQMGGSAETTASVISSLLSAYSERNSLLKEQEELEKVLESEVSTDVQIVAASSRLSELCVDLDLIEADSAEDRALDILRGLQFTKEMIDGPVGRLSGGWRMLLALAKALFVPCEVLLLDECTNHLDLYGLQWLTGYLQRNSKSQTMVVVSHDTAFLDSICSDVVVMAHQQLSHHVGNYSEYRRQESDKAAREARILDTAERQRTKAEAFIQKQQANKKSTDPNKQRQAKMIREKKIDRMGNYREDGKRYKLKSMKNMSESSLRLAQKVQIHVDEPIVRMKLPNPVWPPSISEDDAILRLEGFSFRFDNTDAPLIDDMTLSLGRGDKVAIVGRNGCGKTSLFQLLLGRLCTGKSTGTKWLHQSVRIGHLSQYSVEELEQHREKTVVEYAEEMLSDKRASSRVMSQASGNVRQYLGSFGLGSSKLALGKIGTLSGGERMRLCFATVMSNEPHLLLLDESTNHVDIETLETLSEALNAFTGSVLMISHNQGFLAGFCRQLWTLENGRIKVSHSETESFDELFAAYRHATSHGSGTKLRMQRKDAAQRAKRANQQRAGANQQVALL